MFRQVDIQEQSFDDWHDISPYKNARKPHILVIDDEEDILRLIKIGLEQQSGYDVSTTISTEEAYCLISNFEFDVIMTDVMMPGEDGISFLAKVHQILPDVPIIVMTGFAQLQMAVNAIKNGAFEFIHKPFDLIYLRQVIRKAVTYASLRRMEKDYRIELEQAVTHRTDELKHALAQLEAMRATVLKASSDKTEFLTTITHEMRTPMNGIIGALDLLADADLSGSQLEYLCLARQSADNMMELVDRVLSFSSGVGRGHTASQELTDLPNAIESVAAAHHPHFTEKGLSFEVRLAPSMPRCIRCDSKQLTRLLDILLSNALKFTEKGGAALEVSLERIEEHHALICVSVSDSGIGIRPEMIEHVFDPFIQEDASLNRRFGGAGLGLSIARQITALFNGEIWAESTPGEGSRFCCRLSFELA
ncbi:MAG TPA: ATP-binding protein [Desulfuromonadaceae bacterium]|jgi:signal transduction histidine kinase